MVANFCFLSIIAYMIAVWGGTEDFVIHRSTLFIQKFFCHLHSYITAFGLRVMDYVIHGHVSCQA